MNKLVTDADVEAAAARIEGKVVRTPLLRTSMGRPEASLWIKAECLQIGGSFKLRGALNALALLTADEQRRGVVTHSSGNHAQALARAAQAAGISATIVMPRQSAEIKRLATLALGATVVLVDASERASAVEEIQTRTGAVFVPPYDNRAIIAGQGTVGVEIRPICPRLPPCWCR